MLFGPAPKYPDMPHAEWKARIDKAKRLMKEQDIGIWFAVQNPNIYSLGGFQKLCK